MKRGREFLDHEDGENTREAKRVKKTIPKNQGPPVLFRNLCNLMRTIEKKKGGGKIRAVKQFWYDFKDQPFYPFMRLLLPHYDRERSYDVKESKIADIYKNVLVLGKKEHEFLKRWKNAVLARDKTSSNFSDSVYSLLIDKGWSTGFKSVNDSKTVDEINKWLDKFAKCDGKTQSKANCIMEIFSDISAEEHRWLVRIILKDLKIGVKDSVLKAYHEDAPIVFASTNDLKAVFDLKMGSKFLLTLELGKPFSPMLAQRCTHDHDLLVKKCQNKDYIVEEKFDGERVLIHYSANKIDYWTRNANHYNAVYSAQFDKYVRKCCMRVKSCILDGEMCVYDKKLNTLRIFGHNRTQGKLNDPNYNFIFKCFDIVYINGQDITKKELYQRKKILEENIDHVPQYFEKVKHENVPTLDKIEDRLSEAILNGNEGVLIKNIKSKYVLRRSCDWVKVKPHNRETLDLIVMGAYYGTKFGGKSLTHFLCGVLESGKDVENNKMNPRVYSFVNIGSGYNRNQLTKIVRTLTPHLKKFNKSKIPDFFCGWCPNGAKYTPDYYIEPKNSLVLMVKWQDIVASDVYQAGLTLRFAFTSGTRDDKDWWQAETYQSIVKIADDQKRGKFVPRIALTKKKKKVGKRLGRARRTTMGTFKNTDVSNIERTSNVFQGMGFVLLNIELDRDSAEKHDLETSIHKMGGTFSQASVPSTTMLIADHVCITVEHHMEFVRKFDIVKLEWLRKCIAEGKKIPLTRKHYWYESRKTKRTFNNEMDEYGDSYFDELTPEELEENFKNIQLSKNSPKKRPASDNRIQTINRKYYSNKSTNVVLGFDQLFLSGLSFYFDDEKADDELNELECQKSIVEIYGGRIYDEITQGVKYIIVNQKLCLPSRIKQIYEKLESTGCKAKVLDLEFINSFILLKFEKPEDGEENEYVVPKPNL